MRRILKQFIYGSLFLSFWALVGYIAWQAWYEPTCIDRIQNQGEEQIDCGGPCAPCELKMLGSPLVFRKAWFYDEKSATVDVGIELKNPNLTWGAPTLPYTLTILNAEGKIVTRLERKSYLFPGETRWVVEAAVPSLEQPHDVSFELKKDAIEWKKFKPFSQEVRLASRNVGFRKLSKPEIGFAELSGEIENQSVFPWQEVEALGFVYDSLGSIIAIGKTELSSLGAGENRFFAMKWQHPFDGEPVRWEAFARANFLVDPAFIQRYAE